MTKHKTWFLGAILLSTSLIGCRETELTPGEYVSWVQDQSNGLIATKQLEDYTFSLQYRPGELVALQEQGPQTTLESFTKRVEQLEGMQYYTLSILPESGSLLKQGISSEQEYYSRLDYFNSYMKNDLMLVEGNDTLPCRLHHYENTNNLRPDHQFILAFAQTQKINPGSKTLIYNDKALGFGPIRLTINQNDLSNIPEITL